MFFKKELLITCGNPETNQRKLMFFSWTAHGVRNLRVQTGILTELKWHV